MARQKLNWRHETSRRPIVVHNTLLDGVSGEGECPCFIVYTVGLAPAALRAECDAVAALQAIAPVFKVVVFSDLPVFDLTRRHGWPLEHFPSLAYRERTASAASVSRYIEERLSLLSASYHKATVISHSEENPLAVTIADAVGVPHLLETAYSLAGDAGVPEPLTGNWESAFEQLTNRGGATLASDGGEALLELPRSGNGRLFVRGADTAVGAASTYRTLDIPDTATICTISFSPRSTLEFESAAYVAVARRYGSKHSVVLPWRSDAVLYEDSMRTIDLAIELVGEQPMVLQEYAQRYDVVAGSREYAWEDGLVYGAARRIARSIAFRR
ncbi:MAG: hypothetical protein ACTMH5_09125 [Brachybacterium sp.]